MCARATSVSRWATVAVAVLVAACATSGVNRGDINLVSLEQEWELGRRLSADLAQKLDLVDDPAATAYLDRLGTRLADRTQLGGLPWEFHLVRDQAVNAFNIPGGHVYVSTGLVTASQNAAQLAGVMAHEVGHGAARHATEQLTRAYGLNVVAALLLGENPAVYEQILAQIAGAGALADFSREAEREADQLGVRYMWEAGYDPNGLPEMFETLLEQRRQRPGAVARFFSTHPLTESRIREVRGQIRELPPKADLITDEPGYRRLREISR